MTQGRFDAKEEIGNMKEKILEKVNGSFCMLPSLILIFNLILKLKKKTKQKYVCPWLVVSRTLSLSLGHV